MAKGTRSSKASTEGDNTNPNAPDLSGYSHVNPELQGWVLVKPDSWVSGIVEGSKISDDPNKKDPVTKLPMKRVQYLIKLTCPAAITRPGEEGEESVGNVGEIVAVDDRTALKALAEFAASPGTQHVHIHFQEKIKIKGGQTFWKCELYNRPVAELPADDIPF